MELIQHIQQDKQNSDYGGILCPHCLIYHTRAAEAVFIHYPITPTKLKNSALREIAINLGNWLIKQQETDGLLLTKSGQNNNRPNFNDGSSFPDIKTIPDKS